MPRFSQPLSGRRSTGSVPPSSIGENGGETASRLERSRSLFASPPSSEKDGGSKQTSGSGHEHRNSVSIFEQAFGDLLDATTATATTSQPLRDLVVKPPAAAAAPSKLPRNPSSSSPATSHRGSASSAGLALAGLTNRRGNPQAGDGNSEANERFRATAAKATAFNRATSHFETSIAQSRFSRGVDKYSRGLAEREAGRKKWQRQKERKINTFMMRLSHAKFRRLQIYPPIFGMIAVVSVLSSIQLQEGGLLRGTAVWESMAVLRHLASSVELDWSRLPPALAYLFPMMVVLLLCHITALRSLAKLNEVESLLFDYSGHAVVCGTCHQSLKFAALMKKRGYVVVVITRRTAIAKAHNHTELDLTGVRFLPFDNYCNESMLKRAGISRAALFYAATGDDAENMCLAYLVSGLLATCTRRTKLMAWISISELRSATIGDMLARAGNTNLTVELIEYQQAAARLCVEAYPPWGNRSGPPISANVEPPIHVVVIGLKAIGRNLVHQLIKVGHFADEAKLHITIISCNADEVTAYRMLHAQYPHLETIVEIQNIEEQPEFITDERWRLLQRSFGPVQTIYIADIADELRVVQIALGLRTLPLASPGTPMTQQTPPPVIVVCIDTPNHKAHHALFEAFREQFSIFSVHDKVQIEELVDQRLDALAKVVHETYRQDYGGKPWEELSFRERANNRHAADHFSVRKGILVHAGGGYADIIDNAPKIAAMLENRSGIYAHLLESLAKVEHRRWVATKMLDGWKTGYGEKNDLRKEHPSLVPYDLLSETEKGKCRKSVLGLPNQLVAAQEVAASNSNWYSNRPPIFGFGWMFMALHLFTYVVFTVLVGLIALFLLELFTGNNVNPLPAAGA